MVNEHIMVVYNYQIIKFAKTERNTKIGDSWRKNFVRSRICPKPR